MELNKNPSHRSDSAARLLDTPSDLEEEMIPLSESDEHLNTAISLRIDSSHSSQNDHSLLSPTRIMIPFNIPLNEGTNGYGHKTSPNVLWPGNGHGVNGHGVNGHGVNGHGVNGHGVNGQSSRREVERASSVIDLSEEIDGSEERGYIRSNEPSPLQSILPRDTRLRIKPEIIIAFLLAGLGNVAAGYMLAKVQLWNVFKSIPQLLILVQPLLGLKGNVEMTLASRLSTHSNLGDLDNPTDRNLILFGNMALIQCQASVVGFIAPIVAIVLSFSSDYERESLDYKEMVLIVASSVITANVANLILGTIMCLTIILCRKYSINPDNISTPIAASLGDVTTLVLLAYISHWLYGIISHSDPSLPDFTSLSNHPQTLNDHTLLQHSLLILLITLIPLWAYLARTNPYTKNVIVTGWFPVCGAMLLQNAGGLVMERACEAFEKLAKFQPIINGVGGNLVAIQASRMSTHLHKNCVPKQLPPSDPVACPYPGHTFFSSESAHTRMARLLLLLAGPAHVVFLSITKLISPDFFVTPSFVLMYLMMSVIQVGILLQSCDNFVHWLWSVGVDPDNTAIPFLTAVADLIGSLLLALTFILLFQLGDPNAMVKLTPFPSTDGADHALANGFIANLYNSSARME